MENEQENTNDKKELSKAKFFKKSPSVQLPAKPVKRKSGSLDEAVKSLDMALVRLKKIKLETGEGNVSSPNRSTVAFSEVPMDVSSDSPYPAEGVENPSQMSLSFSHYEMVRNLSRSTLMSDGACSGTTCSASICSGKDEFLEKYLRSIDEWNKTHHKEHPNIKE